MAEGLHFKKYRKTLPPHTKYKVIETIGIKWHSYEWDYRAVCNIDEKSNIQVVFDYSATTHKITVCASLQQTAALLDLILAPPNDVDFSTLR